MELDRTPTLLTVTPTTGQPGQQIAIYGRIFTNRVRQADATSDNGRTATLRRVWVEGKECLLFQSSDTLYVSM